AHLTRLQAGCEVLGLPPPDLAEARRACERAIAEAGLAGARAAVRLTLTAGSGGAVMLNTRGEVASAAAANLFWLMDGRLFTPALDCGVLAGVMRAAVIAAAQARGQTVAEARVGEGELRAAEAVFLTSSLIGVRPVNVLDGRPLAASPMAGTLARWVADV